MADDVVEGSIYNQVKAMESWALEAYQESVKNSPNMDLILKNLRKINLQGRKLEWRGKGLESLPKGQVAEDLKKKITQLRAAVVTLRDIKKDKDLSNASKRTLQVLSGVATEARKLVEQFAKGLPNLENMGKDQIEDFFLGKGEYAAYALDVRRKLWNDYSKVKREQMNEYNLSGCDLRGFDFGERKILGADFSQANLTGASFSHSLLDNCSFLKSNLQGTDFSWCSFVDTNFRYVKASKANFTRSSFRITKISNLLFNGDFDSANFSSVNADVPTTLDNVIFNNADFSRARLYWKDITNSSLRNANLRGARIRITREAYSKINFGRAKNSGSDATIEYL